MLIDERWILAALRHRTFFSFSEPNQVIHELLIRLNNRKFRKLNTTRTHLFETLEKPTPMPLPSQPFHLA